MKSVQGADWVAPYKNKSDVFGHLVDDPADRQGKLNIEKPGSRTSKQVSGKLVSPLKTQSFTESPHI